MKMDTVDGRRFSVVFRYYDGYPNTHRVTICDILNEEGDILSKAAAMCRRGDQFRKSVGRKIALARALRYVFPRADDACFRAEVWFSYHSRPGSKVDANQAALKFGHRAMHQGRPLGFLSLGSKSPKLQGERAS